MQPFFAVLSIASIGTQIIPENAPETIKAAAHDPLGIIALVILVLSGLALAFFRNAPPGLKLLSFLLLLVSFLYLAVSVGPKVYQGLNQHEYDVKSPTPANPPLASAIPTSSGTGTPEQLSGELTAVDVVVEQAQKDLKDGNWSRAVEAFGKALKIEPANERASEALWRALSEQSDGYLVLPDRAYVWPHGAGLINLAEKAPLALTLDNTNVTSGGKPSYYVYNYESGKQFWVCEAPPYVWVAARFVCEDRRLQIPREKSGTHLFAFNDSGAWEVSSLPEGCSGPETNVPNVEVIWGRDAKGHYMLYSDSKTHLAHIHDLVARRDVCEPLRSAFGVDLSGNGLIIALKDSNLTDKLRACLAQLFALWILPENAGTGLISFTGDFRLEIENDGKDLANVYLRQRVPDQTFQLFKQSGRTGLLPWKFHSSRDELYLQAGDSLCVFNLPTMPYFPSDAAPAFPGKSPGKSIHRFLSLIRQETPVKLCRERDELHSELIGDQALPIDKKHFADLPEEWRKLLTWWTAKPAERKPWQ